MGTSVNQRSSTRGAWAAQHVVLGATNVSMERQAIEVWRAAFGDRDQSLTDELCSPEILNGARIADSAVSSIAASARFDEVLDEMDSGSLAVEFARRSLVRATSSEGGAISFGADLFAETASYLVSRDLPSYVGSQGRITSSSEAIELKRAIRELSRTAATTVANTFSGEQLTTEEGWRAFVSATAKALGSGGRDA